MNEMIKRRLVGNRTTTIMTICGIAVVVASIVSVFVVENIGWAEATAGITIGVALITAKYDEQTKKIG